MHKSLTAFVIQFLAAGIMLAGYAAAQQTPAATASQSVSAQVSGQSASNQASSSQAAAPAKTQAGPATKKTTTAPSKTAAPPVVLKTEKDKESYAQGMSLGMGLRNQGLTLDPALVARGLKDAQSGAKTAMTEDEARAALKQFWQEAQQKMGAAQRKEGEAFLAANKIKEGVVTLPSGLQYKILTQGNGPKPTLNDTVSCNYRGTLINGKEFDSSARHGGPATFPVSRVIKGWTEALQIMPVGSKWDLFIPPDLAYGDRGAGGDIAPGSTLIFEIELLSIGEQKK